MTSANTKILHRVERVLVPLIWLVGYLVIVLQWTGGSGSTIAQSFSSALVALGSLAGLSAAYIILSQFLLQSRLPLIEAPFGRAKLVRVHRLNGYAIIIVLYIHASFLIIGYSLANHLNPVAQDLQFLKSYPYVLWSSIALTLFTLVVALSISIVRRHLKYESWYYVHLITYVAVLLAFKHQLAVGLDFLSPNAQVFRDYWWALYLGTLAAIIVFRFGKPVYRTLRFGFRVDRIEPAANNTYSVYVTGRSLNKLHYVPGQFIIWRFLDRKRFWQAHPFTISQAFNGKNLRLTFKAVGDFTSTLAELKPGTPVLIDGPYGDFTLAEETNPKLLFIAGGIGLTPLRSMLEQLPAGTSAELIYSARTSGDIALKAELERIATKANLKLHYVLSDETVSGYDHGILDGPTVKRLVPDYRERTVYLCGPPPMMAGVTSALESIGVPAAAIKTERFAF